MGPQNYILRGIADPGLAFSQGLQDGEQAVIQQQALAMQQQQQQQAMRQQQQAMEAAARREAALQAVINNPRPGAADFSRLMMLMPKESEALKRSWETLNTEQSQSRLADLSQWTAAIEAGRPDVAVNSMIAQADAIDAQAGKATPEGKALRAQADIVRADPKTAARVILGPLLAAHPDGGKVLDNISKRTTEERAAELQPLKVRQEAADATTKEVTAKYAERNALTDLEQKGWNIKALQADIDFKRQSTRIAAMNAAVAREGNDLKREELRLKIDEARSKLDGAVREKVATAEAGAANIDNMLNTVERIKRNPSLSDVVGSIEGRLPVIFSDEAADATALIETLGSQAFLAQIPNIKGMGALSNAEGEKLQAALQNLSRVQSAKQFRANLDEASRLLKKGRENLSRATGVPLGKPDTPAAPASRPPLDSFFK